MRCTVWACRASSRHAATSRGAQIRLILHKRLPGPRPPLGSLCGELIFLKPKFRSSGSACGSGGDAHQGASPPQSPSHPARPLPTERAPLCASLHPEGPDRCAALHRAHFIPPSTIPIRREPLNPVIWRPLGAAELPVGEVRCSLTVQPETTPWEFTGQLRGPRAGGAGGSQRQPPCPGAPFFRCLQRTAFAMHRLLGQRLCLKIGSGKSEMRASPSLTCLTRTEGWLTGGWAAGVALALFFVNHTCKQRSRAPDSLFTLYAT